MASKTSLFDSSANLTSVGVGFLEGKNAGAEVAFY